MDLLPLIAGEDGVIRDPNPGSAGPALQRIDGALGDAKQLIADAGHLHSWRLDCSSPRAPSPRPSRAARSAGSSSIVPHGPVLTLAASALALRAMPDEHGGWTGAITPVAVLAAALVLPERWTLLALPADTAWHAAQQRWTALLALGLLALAYASREPVTRSRHKLPD